MNRLHSRSVQMLRRLASSNFGGIAILMAISLPVLIGLVGAAAETALLFELKRRAQTAADSAAVAGAYQRARGDTTNVLSSSKRAATINGFTNGSSSTTVTVNYPPTSGTYAGQLDAVEVIVTRAFSPIITKFLHPDNYSVRARAVAEVLVVGKACILALHTSASNALYFQGSTYLNNAGCVVASNSNSATAVNMSGSATLTAEAIWSVGAFNPSSHPDQLFLARGVQSNMWALADPYASVSLGTVPACATGYTSSTRISNTRTLSPGTYCGGLDLRAGAVVTLNPGTYYIDAGEVTVNASATLICNCTSTEGVTIVLTNTATPTTPATIKINGGATVDLKAPATGSGNFDGLLIYQDPRATSTYTNKLNGGSSMLLRGGIYFPKQDAEFTGDNSSVANTCVMLIASTVTFIGNSTIYNTGCDEAGVTPLEIKGVRLRE